MRLFSFFLFIILSRGHDCIVLYLWNSWFPFTTFTSATSSTNTTTRFWTKSDICSVVAGGRASRNILNSKPSLLVPQQQWNQPYHHYCPRKQWHEPSWSEEEKGNGSMTAIPYTYVVRMIRFFDQILPHSFFKSARSEDLARRASL